MSVNNFLLQVHHLLYYQRIIDPFVFFFLFSFVASTKFITINYTILYIIIYTYKMYIYIS